MQTVQNQSTTLQHVKKSDLLSVLGEYLKTLPDVFTVVFISEAKARAYTPKELNKWEASLPTRQATLEEEKAMERYEKEIAEGKYYRTDINDKRGIREILKDSKKELCLD
jgi:hypothetical protein